MSGRAWGFVVGVVGVLAAIAPAVAQPPAAPAGPALQPPFSPYLNLARRNSSPAINYFGIVRPQMRLSNQLQTLQTQVNQPSPFDAAGQTEQQLVTGNPFGFQNYRAYFQNQYTAGGFAVGVGGRGPAPGAASPAGAGGPIGLQFTPQPNVAVPAPRRR